MVDVLLPRALARGDRVALVSPAGAVGEGDVLRRGIERLRGYGLVPDLLDHARDHLDYPAGSPLAGTDDERLRDLQRAISDPRYRAVIAVRGGYGTARILDRLDLSPLRDDPKPILGYSDLTALLAAAWSKLRLVSFHGPMVVTGDDHDAGDDGWALQRALLCDAREPAKLPPRGVAHALRPGRVRGRLLGGNLTLVCTLIGTPWEIDTKGAILFLEDVGEAPYRIDRMLTQLRHTGALARAAGIAFGDFHLDGTPLASESKDVLEVLVDRTRDLDLPVVHGLPFGHRPGSWTLPVGGLAELDARDPGRPARLTLLAPAVAAR